MYMYVHDTSFKKLLPFERDRKLNSKMREIEKNTMQYVHLKKTRKSPIRNKSACSTRLYFFEETL